jgi:hypothetical protein
LSELTCYSIISDICDYSCQGSGTCPICSEYHGERILNTRWTRFKFWWSCCYLNPYYWYGKYKMWTIWKQLDKDPEFQEAIKALTKAIKEKRDKDDSKTT